MHSNAVIGRAPEAIVLPESRREAAVGEESQGHWPFLVLTAGAALMLAFLLLSS